MITLGNGLLYASFAVGAVALIGLLLKEFKNIDVFYRFVSPMILLSAGLLTLAYVLLTYYFAVSDFTYEYIWEFSSIDLPMIYKISGTWAGQQGTYLMWVCIIFISAAWLVLTTKHATRLARRTQIITLLIGLYFIVLTLIQTPFKSIYEGRPDLIGYVPPDGNGLNALLVNFWMVVHPPLMFIGYAAMTIPFAAAIVYLITKEEGWEDLSRQWARFTWLFLGMGIAIGGVWAYLVLGWGGFWAWDPVETASFIPWLTLTGYLHAASLHRKNRSTFAIAAPLLACVSFILVLYAAIVVRSGIFNSVHAFGEATTGTLLITSILIVAIVSGILAMKRYFEESETEEADPGFWTKTNVFYVTLLLFVVLAFISFWGITYPVFIQLTQGIKVNVASETKNFFNIWSYPFTILLLSALGFCLNYRESDKENQKRNLFIVLVFSILAMFPRTDGFYVLDHNSPFWAGEPPLYKLIGNISLLSIFPSIVYAVSSIIGYLQGYFRKVSAKVRIKGAGLTMIHLGVVFIIFGAVISSNLDTKIEGINIPIGAKGQIIPVAGDYSIKIIDFSTRSLTETAAVSGTKISEIIENPGNFETGPVDIRGKVTSVVTTNSTTDPVTYWTYFEINDDTGSIWAVVQTEKPITIQEGIQISVKGSLMGGIKSTTTNTTYDLIIFTDPENIGETAAVS
ncbi:MAG: cytochrome c biogenesis protein CcsA, partial [Candidatus Methanoperedens sp.]|nr:cytochrome c biogenesis protein CcsA [Candidatus Methanoperedens sp.]